MRMVPVVRRNGGCGVPAEGAFSRLDTLFDRVFGENGGFEAVASGVAGVPIAIWEDEDHVHIEVDAPGVSENDVDLTFHQGLLTIKWERKGVEGRKYFYNSRNFGGFERSVRLPETVGQDGVEAKLKDGVLYLALKKVAEAKPRKIVVQKVD